MVRSATQCHHLADIRNVYTTINAWVGYSRRQLLRKDLLATHAPRPFNSKTYILLNLRGYMGSEYQKKIKNAIFRGLCKNQPTFGLSLYFFSLVNPDLSYHISL